MCQSVNDGEKSFIGFVPGSHGRHALGVGAVGCDGVEDVDQHLDGDNHRYLRQVDTSRHISLKKNSLQHNKSVSYRHKQGRVAGKAGRLARQAGRQARQAG